METNGEKGPSPYLRGATGKSSLRSLDQPSHFHYPNLFMSHSSLVHPSELNPRWDAARSKAWLAACVAVQVFESEKDCKKINIEIPREIEDIYADILIAVRTCAQACNTQGTSWRMFWVPWFTWLVRYQVTLPWSLRDYEAKLTKMQNGFNSEAERRMKVAFPPPKNLPRHEHRPFIIVDKLGEVGGWHLPSALSPRLQRIMEHAMIKLNRSAPTLLQVGVGPATRSDPGLFRQDPTDVFGHGIACMSYCWFQQGHEVSFSEPNRYRHLNRGDRHLQTKTLPHRAAT